VTAQDVTNADRSRLDGKVIGVLPKDGGIHDGLRAYVSRISGPLTDLTVPEPDHAESSR
jgi:hypothetical protein